MQVLNSLRSAKQRHPDCQIVKRKGRLYVICKSNPRFKAVQGGKKALACLRAKALQGTDLLAIGAEVVAGQPSLHSAINLRPLRIDYRKPVGIPVVALYHQRLTKAPS